MEYQVIMEMEHLHDAMLVCSEARVLTIDTEFVRVNTYYPEVGLIQIYDGERCFLIDPIALPDLQPLEALMLSSSTVKVFHSCSEDLEVFQHAMGIIPRPIFDTQIGAALLGIGFSTSYQRLVEHYLGIELLKYETRSDWLKRPLTDNQLKYAALDVVHLHEVYSQELKALSETNRLGWVSEECAGLGLQIPTMIDPNQFYKKVKGASVLDRSQLNVLRDLCSWREVTARNKNIPRNRVIEQKSLLAIAKLTLFSKNDLIAVTSITPKQFRQYGDVIFETAEEARQQEEDLCPEIIPRSRGSVNSEHLQRLRRVVTDCAESLSISPEFLVKRRHLEELLRFDQLPDELNGWRKEAVGNALLLEMASF